MNQKTDQSKKINRSFCSGFTLVELMISMAVLAIMISAAIVSLIPAKNQAKVKAVQAEVATTIKTIQSYALQGKVAPDGKVPAGYGFEFTSAQTYIIFYCVAGSCGDPGQDITHVVSTFSFQDKGVTLTNPSTLSDTRIFFDIPYGNLNPILAGDLSTMTLTLSGISKNIIVKKTGAVIEE